MKLRKEYAYDYFQKAMINSYLSMWMKWSITWEQKCSELLKDYQNRYEYRSFNNDYES